MRYMNASNRDVRACPALPTEDDPFSGSVTPEQLAALRADCAARGICRFCDEPLSEGACEACNSGRDE